MILADAAATSILQHASPYGGFARKVRRDAEEILIMSRTIPLYQHSRDGLDPNRWVVSTGYSSTLPPSSMPKAN